MKLKRMPVEQFQSVLGLEWAPAQLLGNAVPSFLGNIPPNVLHTVHASGCLPTGDSRSIPSGAIIGGIDVYRNAPDDPVEFNKDWYAVVWNPSEPRHLLIKGLQKDAEHWINEVRKVDLSIEAFGVPAKPIQSLEPLPIRLATRSEAYALFRRICGDGVMPILFDSDRLARCDEIFAEEVNGSIVGVVCLASNGCDGSGTPTLATLYTAPEYRGKGIGLRLCEYGIRRFVETGKTPIFCDVTTRGMHATIDRLPGELQRHLKTNLSYQKYGDEFEDRPW